MPKTPQHAPQQAPAQAAPMRRGGGGLLRSMAMAGLHLAAALLLLTMLAISANAVLRYAFDAPMHIITELAGFAFLLMIFLGAAGTFLLGGHIIVELVVGQLPERLRIVFRDVLMGVVGIVYVGLLLWAGAEATWQLFLTGAASTGTTPIPYWMALVIMPVGALLLILAQVSTLFEAITKLVRTSESTS